MSFSFSTVSDAVSSKTEGFNAKAVIRRVSGLCCALLCSVGVGAIADTVVVAVVNGAVALSGSFFFSYLVYVVMMMVGFAAVIAAAVVGYRLGSGVMFDAAAEGCSKLAGWLRPKAKADEKIVADEVCAAA
jgi:hypothetical protein